MAFQSTIKFPRGKTIKQIVYGLVQKDSNKVQKHLNNTKFAAEFLAGKIRDGFYNAADYGIPALKETTIAIRKKYGSDSEKPFYMTQQLAKAVIVGRKFENKIKYDIRGNTRNSIGTAEYEIKFAAGRKYIDGEGMPPRSFSRKFRSINAIVNHQKKMGRDVGKIFSGVAKKYSKNVRRIIRDGKDAI